MKKFLEKVRSTAYRFMYGRYGTDTLSKVILWVYAGVMIAYLILQLIFQKNLTASIVLSASYFVISTSLIYWMFFRIFSRNIYKRRRENERFCGFFKLRKNKWRDRKTHVYRKCPKCKAVLRLPKAKGKHNVVCPRCKNRFEVRG